MYSRDTELPTATLEIVKGPSEGLRIKLSPAGLILGRNPQCAIHLDHASVSRTHARIFLHDGAYYIEDLNSRNGVLVNGRRGTRIRLQNCDRIKICGYQFEFQEQSPSETARAQLAQETSV
jgi:pSer/pThr/pTyr-binding forkhead associated (FHA) protein